MAARFEWKGLRELQVWMEQLPAAVKGEARHIVQDTANGAAVRIRSNYSAHVHTGRLRDSVRVSMAESRHRITGTVKTSAPHAHLFEFGTAARQTSQGWKRGIMPAAPPAHAFLPVIEQDGRRMIAKFLDVLRRYALEARRDAA